MQRSGLELLAAACAVGVASNFGAPIGGVLFSIEVTATYFAVRNYWRGFYASVVGAFVFRLLDVIKRNERTITAIFTTEFITFPFALSEMIVFAFIGVLGGLFGSLFVYFHRKLIDWRNQLKDSPRSCLAIVAKNNYLYALVVTFLIATVTVPGRWLLSSSSLMTVAGRGWDFMSLTQTTEINHLFNNHPLTDLKVSECFSDIVLTWLQEWGTGNVFVNLALFAIFKFVMTALALTLPVPGKWHA